jgi:hypothetical protein
LAAKLPFSLCEDENGGFVLNKDEIREKYEEFVGTDRYLSFLATVQGSALRKGRLKYKQEIEWNKFITEYNLKIKEVDEICSYFQYCYQHKVEFEKDMVKILYGTRVPPSDSALKKSNSLYPHANIVAYGPCWVEDKKTTEVSYCSKCRENYYKENERVSHNKTLQRTSR